MWSETKGTASAPPKFCTLTFGERRKLIMDTITLVRAAAGALAVAVTAIIIYRRKQKEV